MNNAQYLLYTKCNELSKDIDFDRILEIEEQLFSRQLINWRILDLPDLKKLHQAFLKELEN